MHVIWIPRPITYLEANATLFPKFMMIRIDDKRDWKINCFHMYDTLMKITIQSIQITFLQIEWLIHCLYRVPIAYHGSENIFLKRNKTLVIWDAWAWCSMNSPASVKGYLTERRLPVLVPQNNIRPECDMATCVSVEPAASTVRKIWHMRR